MDDRAIIESFARGTIDTFQQMCGVLVAPSRAVTTEEREPGEGVHSIIGMDGEVCGTIGLSFPDRTACTYVGMLIDEEYESVNADVVDGIQEFVNVLIGAAKKYLEKHKCNYEFGLPKTMVGLLFATDEGADFHNVGVVLNSEHGRFLLNMTWKIEQNDG